MPTTTDLFGPGWLGRHLSDAAKQFARTAHRPRLTGERAVAHPTWVEQSAMADDLLRPFEDVESDDNEYVCGLRDMCHALLHREAPSWLEAE